MAAKAKPPKPAKAPESTYKNQRQYSIENTKISPTPIILKSAPKRNISQIFTPPLLKTIAFGGVEIGNINENPTQIVATSITRLCIGGSRNDLVEA